MKEVRNALGINPTGCAGASRSMIPRPLGQPCESSACEKTDFWAHLEPERMGSGAIILRELCG